MLIGLSTTSHAHKLKWGSIPKSIDNRWSNSQAYIHAQAL